MDLPGPAWTQRGGLQPGFLRRAGPWKKGAESEGKAQQACWEAVERTMGRLTLGKIHSLVQHPSIPCASDTQDTLLPPASHPQPTIPALEEFLLINRWITTTIINNRSTCVTFYTYKAFSPAVPGFLGIISQGKRSGPVTIS